MSNIYLEQTCYKIEDKKVQIIENKKVLPIKLDE